MGERLGLSPELSFNHYANCTDEVEIGQVRGSGGQGSISSRGHIFGKDLEMGENIQELWVESLGGES